MCAPAQDEYQRKEEVVEDKTGSSSFILRRLLSAVRIVGYVRLTERNSASERERRMA